MTVNATDMSTPVTRGELREELDQRLAPLATKAELERFATKADLERFATKADLERYATKADLKAELERFATKDDLQIWGGALLERMTGLEQRLGLELARHVKAMQETLSKQVSVIDEKYADLPPRVSRLEGVVLGGKEP